ncbi:hypothetical protein K466DRAFT_591616 [Polyporus arcularius HHB13444]|uniref:Uncharacterized protein n=1 Tax=Polyporus arcularius HHB13444 TaxID=1314778 RepID=A0A5C3NU28_9APHY|nr:hypothetical protein K466DRAFT_591616 [Polyporus arcularius HHB13444]
MHVLAPLKPVPPLPPYRTCYCRARGSLTIHGLRAFLSSLPVLGVLKPHCCTVVPHATDQARPIACIPHIPVLSFEDCNHAADGNLESLMDFIALISAIEMLILRFDHCDSLANPHEVGPGPSSTSIRSISPRHVRYRSSYLWRSSHNIPLQSRAYNRPPACPLSMTTSPGSYFCWTPWGQPWSIL